MIIFLEGGKANGYQIKIDNENVPIYLPYGNLSLKYEEAKPFRLWQGLPVYVEAEIELPQSRLDTLEYYNDTGDILEYMQRLYHWSRKKIL